MAKGHPLSLLYCTQEGRSTTFWLAVGLCGALPLHPGLLQRASYGFRCFSSLMETRPISFTGLLHFYKMPTKFHRVSTAIHDGLEQFMCRFSGMTGSQVGHYVHPEEYAFLIIHVLAEKMPHTDNFQFQEFDIRNQFVHQFTKS